MEMKRKSKRAFNEMRKVTVQKGFVKYALGSCLFEMGDTRVICAVTLNDKVPLFLQNTGQGWITAEYGLLPSSTLERVPRTSNLSGRSQEIQRMIGRSLRGVVDMRKLGERTLFIDCDVIQADGGTRTASVTGAFIALVEALGKMRNSGLITLPILRDYLAAVSVGIVQGNKLLDLDYSEDKIAGVDFNIVMTGTGQFVEIQGTGEGRPFSGNDLTQLLELAGQGIKSLIEIEKECLKDDIQNLLGH